MWKLRDNLRFSGKGNKIGFAGGLEDWRRVEMGVEGIEGVGREGEGVRRDRWNWGHLGRGRNLVQRKRPRI